MIGKLLQSAVELDTERFREDRMPEERESKPACHPFDLDKAYTLQGPVNISVTMKDLVWRPPPKAEAH